MVLQGKQTVADQERSALRQTTGQSERSAHLGWGASTLAVVCVAVTLIVGCDQGRPPIHVATCRLASTHFVESCYAPSALSTAQLVSGVNAVNPTSIVQSVTHLRLQSAMAYSALASRQPPIPIGIAYQYGNVPDGETFSMAKPDPSPFIVVFEEGGPSGHWRLRRTAGRNLWVFTAHNLRVAGNVGEGRIQQIGFRILNHAAQ